MSLEKVDWRKTHGQGGTVIGVTRSRAYVTWNSMLQRCENPNAPSYRWYGGRGITVCPKWHSFEGFFEDMGDRPSGTSIDRIDPNLGYFKENCRWATPTEQCSNLRTAKKIPYEGEIISLGELSRRTGIPAKTLSYRLKMNFSNADLIAPPTYVPPNAKKLMLNGTEITLSELSKSCGVPHKTLAYRVSAGWRIEDICIPVGASKKRAKAPPG